MQAENILRSAAAVFALIAGSFFYTVKKEIEIKTERLRAMLESGKFGGVLLGAQHNFAWLTGGGTNGINLNSESGACALFVRRDGKKFVLANNIEMPRILAEELSAADFEPVGFAWQEEKGDPGLIFEKTRSLAEPGGRIVSDLALHGRIEPVEHLVARCRFELTPAEIERFKDLGRDAGAALGSALRTIAPGETEIEIARKTRGELAKLDCESVVTLVGADERIEKYRHPVPTANVWKKTLMIVVCARRAGLIASLTRIICAGEIPGPVRRRTEAAAYVFARILSETRPGKTGAELYRIAAEAYAEKDFAGEIDLHHQGGAAGYKTRDWVIHPKSADVVLPNQAFAFNPSITGTKSEETALLIGDRIETITATGGFPQIRVETGGREFFSPGILRV